MPRIWAALYIGMALLPPPLLLPSSHAERPVGEKGHRNSDQHHHSQPHRVARNTGEGSISFGAEQNIEPYERMNRPCYIQQKRLRGTRSCTSARQPAAPPLLVATWPRWTPDAAKVAWRVAIDQ